MTDPNAWVSNPGPAAAQQIRRLAEAAQVVDGVAPLGGHVLDAIGSPQSADDAVLLEQRGGRAVGVAVQHGADPAELVVHPDFRGQGIGRRLLAAASERAGRVWAHGNLPAAQALAATTGMTIVRTLLQMRRSLPAELTSSRLPRPLSAGVRLRTFVPGQDEEQFLAVNARAFAWHPEQGRLDAAGLAAEMAQDWFDPAGFFLAVDADDRVLGFHWTKVHPSDPTPQAQSRGPGRDAEPAQGRRAQTGPIGEIYVLAVDPQSPIRGLGGPLTAAGLDHLTARGLPTVMLYVEGDNEPAVALYRRFGFVTAVTDVVYAVAEVAAAPLADADHTPEHLS